MTFAKSQDAWEHVESTKVIHACCVDKLYAHLPGEAELEFHKLALRRGAKGVVEQQHAGLTFARVFVAPAHAQLRERDVEQHCSRHLFAAGKRAKLCDVVAIRAE